MKVSIIGAGISGLSSGIFALEKGHDVTIYEKNTTLGGTFRDLYLNDYFIFDKDEPFYKRLGLEVMEDEARDYLTSYKDVYLYNDLDKLEAHLKEKSISDTEHINDLIKHIKQCSDYYFNYDEPFDLLGFVAQTKLLFKKSNNKKIINKNGFYNIKEYFDTFIDNDIRILFTNILSPLSPAYMLFILLANNAKGKIRRIKNKEAFLNLLYSKFTSMGGKIRYRSDLNKIEINRNKVVGIYVNHDKQIDTDAVIACIDPYDLFYRILEGRCSDRKFIMRFDDYNNYPLYSVLSFTFSVKENLALPHDFILHVTKTKIATNILEYVSVVYKENNLIVSLYTNNNDYKYFQILSKSEGIYQKEIEKIESILLKLVTSSLKENYNIDAHLACASSISPLELETKYERYQGNISGFSLLKDGELYISYGKLDNVKGLYISPSWIERPCHILRKMINAKDVVLRMDKDMK